MLLIDEIDKADLEFPNDLLWELDKMEFFINETKETITAKTRPIVIITSNAEKELPDAFLRRCIFHYIEFPDEEKMAEIIKVHYGELDTKSGHPARNPRCVSMWRRAIRKVAANWSKPPNRSLPKPAFCHKVGPTSSGRDFHPAIRSCLPKTR